MEPSGGKRAGNPKISHGYVLWKNDMHVHEQRDPCHDAIPVTGDLSDVKKLCGQTFDEKICGRKLRIDECGDIPKDVKDGQFLGKVFTDDKKVVGECHFSPGKTITCVGFGSSNLKRIIHCKTDGGANQC